MSTSAALAQLAKVQAAYVARKTAQISALEEKLWEMERRPYAIQWLRRLKLKRKIDRLKAELAQPVLFDGSQLKGGGKPRRRLERRANQF